MSNKPIENEIKDEIEKIKDVLVGALSILVGCCSEIQSMAGQDKSCTNAYYESLESRTDSAQRLLEKLEKIL